MVTTMQVLEQHAELIRTSEVRRCRALRHDARLLELADRLSASVVAALLQPIAVHVSVHGGEQPAGRCIRTLFGLPADGEPPVDDAA